jgi:type II secretory pathway pseudopilin PulG
VAVLLVVGVVAAVAVPNLQGSSGLRSAAWRDQVLAALRHAHGQAQGHRRLVCATLASGEVRLTIARANPATACDAVLGGPDGDARWAHDASGIALTQSPAGTLYFQPDGRITRDGAGASPVDVTVGLAGESALQISGETGHVR